MLTGNWEFSTKTPIGPKTSSVELKEENGVVNIKETLDGVTTEITDGKFENNTLCYNGAIKTPIGMMKIEVSLTLDGDALEGNAKSKMGNMKVTGKRVG